MAELPLHGPDLRDSDEDQRLYWWFSEDFEGIFSWELFKLYRLWKAHENTEECSRSHSASPSPYLRTWKPIVRHLFWAQQKLLKQTHAQKNMMAGPLVQPPQVGSRLNEILVPWTLQEPPRNQLPSRVVARPFFLQPSNMCFFRFKYLCGDSNPYYHIMHYPNAMALYRNNDALMCKMNYQFGWVRHEMVLGFSTLFNQQLQNLRRHVHENIYHISWCPQAPCGYIQHEASI